MTNEERKIYDMVVRRFLAVLYPASQYEQVTMEAKAAGETFAASGKVIKSLGWKEVYEGGADDDLEDEAEDEKKLKDQRLPEMKTGTRLKILKTSLNTCLLYTSPVRIHRKQIQMVPLPPDMPGNPRRCLLHKQVLSADIS